MNYPPLPPATVLKLEPPKAVYRVFRLVSSPLKAPAAHFVRPLHIRSICGTLYP